jgi:uncharacterized membrane protein YjgN (DUF898 family)
MEEGSVAAVEYRLAVRFVGSGSEYFRIWIVNLLLTLVTLGLYYPFAKVRRLRYFLGATEIDGQPLSFHAEPWKMLRGYLLVAAMVVAYSVAGRVSPLAGLVAFVIVAALWPALWHSSLRFRLANTGWRGLRFRFVGARRGAYAALAPGFVVAFALLALSLWSPPGGEPMKAGQPPGPLFWLTALLPLAMLFVLPAMFWLMRRYQHENYALAGERTRFAVPMKAFYGVGLRAIGVSLGLALVAGLLAGLAGFAVAAARRGGADVAGEPGLGAAVLGIALVVVVFLVFQATVAPYITARLQNLVWGGTSSEHVSFDSQLRARPLMWLTAKNWLLIVLTLGLYFPYARVATARLRLQAVTVRSRIAPQALVGVATGLDEAAAGDAAGDLLGLDIGL